MMDTSCNNTPRDLNIQFSVPEILHIRRFPRKGNVLWTDRDCTEMHRFETEEAKILCRFPDVGPTMQIAVLQAIFRENSRSENIPIKK